MDVSGLLAASAAGDLAFPTVVDALPTIVWAARADGTVDYCNRRWDEAFAAHRDWQPLLHNADVPSVLAEWALCLSNGRNFDAECRLFDVSGAYRWYRIAATAQRDERGLVQRWLGTITDVHDLHLSAEQLRVSERQYRAIADSIPQMVWVARADGAIEYLNPQFYRYTGDARGRLRGWSFMPIIHPDDRDRVLGKWQNAIEAGYAYEDEVRLIGANGRYRWFLVTGLPVKNASGAVVRWFGSCTDITAHHEASERNRRMADAFQAVLLPRRLPSIDGIRFDASYTPAYETAKVGGDWYDVFSLGDGGIGISIGDVMGHGTEAAVMMGMLRQRIFIAATDGYPPDIVLQKANELLLRGDFNDDAVRMATAVYGRVDKGLKRLRFATAGHPLGITVRPDGHAEFLSGGDPVLGSAGCLLLRTFDVALEPGTVLVFYTDGLVEFRRDMLGEEQRLLSVVESVALAGGPEPARRIKELMLCQCAPADDIAILTIEIL